MNGHKLDQRVRRFNRLRADINELLVSAKLDRLDPDEKIIWDYLSDAIDYCSERAIQEDEILNLGI